MLILAFITGSVATIVPTTVANVQSGLVPLPLEANTTHSVVCIGITWPRLTLWLGHSTFVFKHINGTIGTAGHTGKVGQPESCIADNLLVNKKCVYHKNIPIVIQKCGYITGNQLIKLQDAIIETHSKEFQKSYNLFSWNCVIWAADTWNSLGLQPVSWILPIPYFLN